MLCFCCAARGCAYCVEDILTVGCKASQRKPAAGGCLHEEHSLTKTLEMIAVNLLYAEHI